MEIRVEKGQLKWKVLNRLFWGFVTLMFPVALYISPQSLHFIAFMMSGAIVSIPISVCIFLQKNWPIDRILVLKVCILLHL